MSIRLQQIGNSSIAYYSNNIFYGLFEEYGMYVEDTRRDINKFLYQVYLNREIEVKIPMVKIVISGLLL